jgi:hypothetical protein
MPYFGIFRAGQPEIAGVLVDNRLSETHEATAEATLFPVDGASPDVTEHVILAPPKITIEAWISNIDGSFIPAIGERAKQALIDLQTLRIDRELLEVVTYHIIYEDMVLVEIKAVHENLETGALKVSCTFQQVNPVQSQLLPIPAETVSEGGGDQGRSEKPAASSEENSGRKTSQDGASTAYTVFNGIVGLF